jgi:hypothetical protein
MTSLRAPIPKLVYVQIARNKEDLVIESKYPTPYPSHKNKNMRIN